MDHPNSLNSHDYNNDNDTPGGGKERAEQKK